MLAGPLSLAATQGISVDFFSSGYLDGSVLRVSFYTLCIQVQITPKGWVSPFGHLGIYRLFASSPELIAGYNVLHRLQLPRHPPYALIRLTI